MKDIELSIVIPFFNEAANVRFVLDGVIQVFENTGIGYEIIAVNNGSIDRTSEIIREYDETRDFLYPVDVKTNRGLGWGLRKGFEQARGMYICYFGGDGQTSPQDVYKMYRYFLFQMETDMVVGRRIQRDDGFLRRFISRVFNSCFRTLFKTKLHDINGTPKIFKAERLRRYDWRSEGWFIDAELILCSLKRDLRIHEYPVRFHRRRGGKTHIDVRAIFEFIHRMIYFFFLRRNLQ
jgi:glycosyltransferase involved in cell wall biosynthesis